MKHVSTLAAVIVCAGLLSACASTEQPTPASPPEGSAGTSTPAPGNVQATGSSNGLSNAGQSGTVAVSNATDSQNSRIRTYATGDQAFAADNLLRSSGIDRETIATQDGAGVVPSDGSFIADGGENDMAKDGAKQQIAARAEGGPGYSKAEVTSRTLQPDGSWSEPTTITHYGVFDLSKYKSPLSFRCMTDICGFHTYPTDVLNDSRKSKIPNRKVELPVFLPRGAVVWNCSVSPVNMTYTECLVAVEDVNFFVNDPNDYIAMAAAHRFAEFKAVDKTGKEFWVMRGYFRTASQNKAGVVQYVETQAMPVAISSRMMGWQTASGYQPGEKFGPTSGAPLIGGGNDIRSHGASIVVPPQPAAAPTPPRAPQAPTPLTPKKDS